MNVLGLNLFHGDASAALLMDGRPVMAVAEERFNRIKHFGGFPRQAIRACLRAGGIGPEQIEHVAIGRSPRANIARKLGYVLANPGLLPNLMTIHKRRVALDDLHLLLAQEMELPLERLRFRVHRVEHHLAHIASAYLCSGFDSAAGLSYDGSGDFVSAMLARCEGGRIEVLKRIYLPQSLGLFYGIVCRFIGFGEFGDEGKVMGLAPYGGDGYREFFEELLRIDTRGDYALNFDYLAATGTDQGFSIGEDGRIRLTAGFTNRLIQRMGPARPPGAPLTRRERDLAYGLQRRFEQAALALMRQLHALVPSPRLALAGGCALNSVVNGKIRAETGFAQSYIQPAAGDEGLALGAALYAYHRLVPQAPRLHLEHALLGQEFSATEIRAALEARGLKYRVLEPGPLLERTAQRLAEGAVVGWFQGRMEWGPRALGARSILAHPGLPQMRDLLNRRVKHRESFRPFAPAIKAERQADYFTSAEPSPFMLHVFPIRPERRAELCAVDHVDHTGRVQSVSEASNRLFYELLEAFERRTGTPVLLNTSFNENEPIVCRPEEAVECFLRTRIDALAIGPCFLERTENGLAADGMA
jgi:carbamoyltransferase